MSIRIYIPQLRGDFDVTYWAKTILPNWVMAKNDDLEFRYAPMLNVGALLERDLMNVYRKRRSYPGMPTHPRAG